MPDGTGEDDNGLSLAQLKQMSWDIGYIRDKLTHNDVSKTLIWRRSSGEHQMILGRIEVVRWSFLSALRYMASSIQAGYDGAAPAVTDFGQSSWTQTQLQAMYDQLSVISAKLASRRTFTMRLSGLTNTPVEMTVGDIEVTNASYRIAIRDLAAHIADGRG